MWPFGQLAKCTACGHECHVRAKTCPNCGKRKPTKGGTDSLFGVMGVVALIVSAMLIGGPDDNGSDGPVAVPRTTEDAEGTTDHHAALPVLARQTPSISMVQAQALAAAALREHPHVCPSLFLPFDSGTQALVNNSYYLRVRCTDDAYLAIVDAETGHVESMTCKRARATIGNYCYDTVVAQ